MDLHSAAVLCLVFGLVPLSGATVRPTAVAGSFYPAEAEDAVREARRLLDAAPPADPSVAVVVPHAGWLYSGAIAARSVVALPTSTRRVILLGPSHRVRFAGAALPDPGMAAFATPSGPIALDRDALRELRRHSMFAGPAVAHDGEHSLEVQLPLLRERLPEAAVVPILVGVDTDEAAAREIARGVAALLGPEAVVVASSDFTHHGAAYGFQPFATDERLPGRLLTLVQVTAGRLAALDPAGFRQQVEVSEDTVCGVRPLQVLADLLSHAFDGAGEVLAVTTSGEASGSWAQSVSYASVAFTGRWTPWRETPPSPPLGRLTSAEGEALVALARATLESHLRHDGSLASWHAAHPKTGNLMAPAGAFVTLHRRGEASGSPDRLRACMGRLGSSQPLYEAVVASAVSAARDPRFPPLAERELPELELEVSVLSAPEPVESWHLIEPGRHGVILSKGSRSAVFLPQVATEQGWDRSTMLGQLARKAGLPADAWREGARFEVFTAQVVEEGGE